MIFRFSHRWDIRLTLYQPNKKIPTVRINLVKQIWSLTLPCRISRFGGTLLSSQANFSWKKNRNPLSMMEEEQYNQKKQNICTFASTTQWLILFLQITRPAKASWSLPKQKTVLTLLPIIIEVENGSLHCSLNFPKKYLYSTTLRVQLATGSSCLRSCWRQDARFWGKIETPSFFKVILASLAVTPVDSY